MCKKAVYKKWQDRPEDTGLAGKHGLCAALKKKAKRLNTSKTFLYIWEKNRKPQRTEGRHHIRCHLRETHVRLWLRLTKCCCFKRTRKNSSNIGKLVTYRSVRIPLGQLHGSDNESLPKRHLIIFQIKASSTDQTQRTKLIHNKQRASVGERAPNFRMIQIDFFFLEEHHGILLKKHKLHE